MARIHAKSGLGENTTTGAACWNAHPQPTNKTNTQKAPKKRCSPFYNQGRQRSMRRGGRYLHDATARSKNNYSCFETRFAEPPVAENFLPSTGDGCLFLEPASATTHCWDSYVQQNTKDTLLRTATGLRPRNEGVGPPSGEKPTPEKLPKKVVTGCAATHRPPKRQTKKKKNQVS